MSNLNTPIWQLTVGEFLEMFDSLHGEPQKIEPTKREVYGISGLAELLGCSKVTAQKIKSSGDIKAAITQRGRKIIVNADLALELLRKQH